VESLRRDEVDRLGRLRLLASALSGRAVQVAPAASGEPAWTDGETIYVDADSGAREQREALAVQASLLAAGSLEPDVVRRLRRRRTSARRYLAVEGHRALAANEPWLPPPLRSLIDRGVAVRGDSPAASLAAALGREAIADPPHSFGAIRARRLLETNGRASREQRDRVLIELEEDENDAGSVADHFSSPAGRGGALGRLLQRMLRAVRQRAADGPPGAATATHWLRAGTRDPNAALSVRMAGSTEEAATESRGTKYPEWDAQRRLYRPDWCTVREIEPQLEESAPLSMPDDHGLRRALARLGTGLDSRHRQLEGDDIDIDAAVEARVDVMAGCAGEEAVYVDALRRRRDLAVLLLLDISGSAAEPGATGENIHEHQRAAAAALATALHQLGDRVALYAFCSQGRSAVHLSPVKRFDDDLDGLVMRRLGSLLPGAYSRLGAAIRHGAAVLEERGATSRRLLVVLSDGLAYDHGYEPAYGAADARRALAEARGRGTGCLCLTIGAGTDVEVLGRVFGSVAHAAIPGPDRLKRVIGPLFRAALRSAEVRRR
jgi:hypothetical protein